MIRFCRILLVLGLSSMIPVRAADQRPNFIVVLCDDLGYGDLHCYGNDELHTPNLDRFAQEGLRLTSCYSSHPNCSPSRTGLMTGRTPFRVGIHNWIPMLSPMHVPPNEITIATLLRDSGYDTALSGKWHLNGRFNLTGQPQPGDHGFNHWFATQNNCLPNHRNPYNFVRNGIPLGPLKGYAAHLVTDEAVFWLREVRDQQKPFFLFVSYHEPHEPIATDPKYEKLYPSEDPSYAPHHGNITQMDDGFGRLLKAVDDLGLRKNTLVFFTSDNGPAKTGFHPNGSSGPLRDKKGFIADGGIRVPGILRWPGRTKPGTVSDTPIIGTDVLPTFCEIAGVDLPKDRPLDGASFLPLFAGEPIRRSTPMYWHFYAAGGAQNVAIRMGDWKLSAEMDAGPPQQRAGIVAADQQTIKTAGLGKMELYNLKNDIAETTDMSSSEPTRFARMAKLLRIKYREVQVESPTWPDWEFARYESDRIEWPSYRGARRVPERKAKIPAKYFDNPEIETVE
jgi:arylsulfatase A